MRSSWPAAVAPDSGRSAARTPKPFLPLLDERSLLQRTVDRLVGHLEVDGPTTSYVVTDRRYADLARAQLPGRAPWSRSPWAGTRQRPSPLPRSAIDRRDDEVMLVLPADHRITQPGRYAAVRPRRRRRISRVGRSTSPSPWSRSASRSTTRPRATATSCPTRAARRQHLGGLDAYPLERFEEKPTPARAAAAGGQPGVAWNAGMFLWRRAGDPASARSPCARHHRPRRSGLASRATLLRPTDHPLDVDRPRGHGGRR